jgi:5-methylcytosine-specific restriction protein A
MTAILLTVRPDDPKSRKDVRLLTSLAEQLANGEPVSWGGSFEYGTYPGKVYLLEQSKQGFAILGFGDARNVTIPVVPPGQSSTASIKFERLVGPKSQLVFANEAELLGIANRAFWEAERNVGTALEPQMATALEKLVADRSPVSRDGSQSEIASLSFSRFCESLGTPLRNMRWSWSAISSDARRAVFTVWDDLIQGDTYELWSPRDTDINDRNGAIEIRKIAESALANGAEVLGIRCYALDPAAVPRRRRAYDEKRLLVLRIFRRGADIAVRILGDAETDMVRSGALLSRDVRYSAASGDDSLDDLGQPPPGSDIPTRGTGGGGSAYQRDAEVRAYVLKRAKGKCEYCGIPGFAMAGGRRYLETHHVISLANQGPDRVDNVIAVCANDHRQAHYGDNAVEIERKMLGILKRIAGAAKINA